MSFSEWHKCNVGEVVDIKHGFAFKGEFFSDEPTDDILLTPGNFKIGGGFKADKFKYYKGNFPKEYILKPDDIIVTMTDLSKEGDTLGYSALVPDYGKKRLLHNQRLGLLQFKRNDFDKRFIYWLLRTKPYQTFIINSASGSTVKHTSPSRIQEFEFEYPDVKIQRRIADILSALDEKIELNRQTNTTLEAISQSIFKEWFVDFNFPGATGEMVESALGMIPRGWRVLPLDEIADFLNGLALQKFPVEKDDDEYLPAIKIRELKNGVTNATDKVSKNIPAKYIVNDRDLLFSWSASLEVKFWVGGEGALNQHLFKVTSKEYPLWFCYFWILHHIADFKGIAEDKTTTMGHIQRHHLSEALCLIPDNLLQMNRLIIPLIDKILDFEQESISLTAIRDELLPKLMSGEIDV